MVHVLNDCMGDEWYEKCEVNLSMEEKLYGYKETDNEDSVVFMFMCMYVYVMQ